MNASRSRLLVAMGLIAVGVAVFLAYLSFTCGECDGHSYGLLDWVVAGLAIGPGFGNLIRWKKLSR